MTIGVSITLLVVGAILAFAIDPGVISGVDLAIVGDILMAAGAFGLLLWLLSGFRSSRNVEDDEHIDDYEHKI
jgi:hypothetical protein